MLPSYLPLPHIQYCQHSKTQLSSIVNGLCGTTWWSHSTVDHMTLLEHGSVSDRPSQATLSHAQVSLQHRKCCVVEAIHLCCMHAVWSHCAAIPWVPILIMIGILQSTTLVRTVQPCMPSSCIMHRADVVHAHVCTVHSTQYTITAPYLCT